MSRSAVVPGARPSGGPRRSPDMQGLRGFPEVRGRYLRVLLVVGVGAYLVRALEPGCTPWTRVARVLMAVLCAALWRLPSRREVDSLRVTWAFVLVALALNLGFGWIEATAQGYPFNFVLLPGLAFAAVLLGGQRLGGIVVAASVVAASLLLAVDPHRDPRGLLALPVFNLGIGLGLLFANAILLGSLLRSGLSTLADATEVLESTRDLTTSLSHTLSERVRDAVAELAAAFDQPGDALPVVARVSAVLAEARNALPAEPVLPEAHLPEKLLAMRKRLATWTVRVIVVAATANLIANSLLLTANVPRVALLVTTCVPLVVLDAIRPRWFRGVALVLHTALAATLVSALLAWSAIGSGLSPAMVYLGVFPVLATGVLGLRMGLVQLAVFTVAFWVGARHSPTLGWTLPVNQALVYGAVCWCVHDVPSRVGAQLAERSAEAARAIRHRRRLVATLFHDLANPLSVVQSTLHLAAEGAAEPEDDALVRSMVGRMQTILGAATGAPALLAPVDAGKLFDAMVTLFGKKLRDKGVVLATHGPRHVRVACHEALLTESVLGNLLSNALKFSPPGATIDLRVLEVEGDAVILAVEDRGAGLPADVREALSRGGSSTSRRGTGGEEGHGHGLMLAQDYVREMGGALELLDRQGGGLSARIRLRAVRAASLPARAAR